MKEAPIPPPTDALKVKCDADNQFSNFERVFRTAMSVPKAEILKREAKAKHQNVLARAKKKRTA
jgi:hypothetical protein